MRRWLARAPRWISISIVGCSVLALTLIIGLLAHQAQTPRSFTVHGSLLIKEPLHICGGVGYSDLHDGTLVQINDNHGTHLAAGQLVSTSDTCRYDINVTDVPSGKPAYWVAISDRGSARFSEAEMRAGPRLVITSSTGG